ncbi:DUF2254 domain-containing protein (plasmid) [Sinorhizobium meliloti]|uniref:DUF2254 domain-containing protein n=1 Tax=Rhizobium meliloti TaxID=382 RepID=UPI002D779826|nr:DUF2254 domain-containing protein [Sinorhizobium meliloti]WRQ71893.1 DUF2254 domain-containing protein [Sinorhizobium meliloti]
MPRWQWLMAQLTRRLWVRATLIGALGVLAAILAAVVDRYIPLGMPGRIGADAVDSILTIMASSMLAVTTFSLNIMVSAYGSATSNVTPRATKLLIEDRLTQTVLSTFIGSFLFSIVGLVVLKTGAYGERGRVVLFVFTIVVITLVVVSLLRWIDHLTRLGRVGETTVRVEEAARKAIEMRLAEPYLGGTALSERVSSIPETIVAVTGDVIGYVQNVDMPALSRLCDKHNTRIFLNVIPGTFVYADTPIACIGASDGDTDLDALRKAVSAAFSIGDERSFDQDPRFGLAVMSEIACRALSPAVNDPGTAIDVIGRSTRLLSIWAHGRRNGSYQEEPKHPNVHVPPLATADLFEDAFMAVARDGAGLIEVQLRIQKALLALARMGDGDFKSAALRQSRIAFDRAASSLPLEADRARLHELVVDFGAAAEYRQ